MAKPKKVYFRYTTSKPRGVKKIRVPQPAKRPVQLKGKPIKKALLRPDTSEFTLHRAGVKRGKLTEGDPLEKYAVPEWKVKGYLGERIVYKMAQTHRHVPGVDFTFQSSLQGGRMELGGIVADFIWPSRKLIVQLQGPTHSETVREAKDKEQASTLESMGYSILYIPWTTTRDIPRLDDWFTKNIDRQPTRGGAYNYGMASADEGVEKCMFLARDILALWRSM